MQPRQGAPTIGALRGIFVLLGGMALFTASFDVFIVPRLVGLLYYRSVPVSSTAIALSALHAILGIACIFCGIRLPALIPARTSMVLPVVYTVIALSGASILWAVFRGAGQSGTLGPSVAIAMGLYLVTSLKRLADVN